MIEATQMAALLLAAAILMGYRSDGARYRGGVSLVSGVVTGSLAAWLLALYIGMVKPDPVGMTVSIAFLGLVVYCRGNVAKMLELAKAARIWRR